MMSSQIKCVYVCYSVKVDNSDLSDELQLVVQLLPIFDLNYLLH